MALLRRWVRPWSAILTAALAALALVGPVPFAAAPVAQAQSGTVRLEWFGWSNFRLTSVNGKVILINPFIVGNPDAAISVDDINQADLILAANGHGDEIGSTVPLAQKTGARVFVPFELGTWIMEQGVPAGQVSRSGQGQRLIMDGITVQMVGAVHGSGNGGSDNTTAAPVYGGFAAGYIIRFENGWTLYFAGSSAATADQALWGSMYKPDAMIFHMAPTKEPMDAAMSIKLVTTDNPNLSVLMPHHHRVDPPPGSTSVADVQAALGAMGVGIPITNQARSQVYEFTK